jgi:dTDP-4-amino-4,6-dideoxygalactose transaminase
LPRTALTVTERLARSTIGLPLYRDMGAEEIDRVVERVRASTAER